MQPEPRKPRTILKLMLRYTTEVIVIFLGITISFLFDQWRENRQKKEDLIELSQSLLMDVEALKAKLSNDLKGSAEWIDQMDSLRLQRTSNKISDAQFSWFYGVVTGQSIFLFNSHSPTYLSAANSNLFSELPDTVKTDLYKLYQVQLPYFQLLYNLQQENITHFRNNVVVASDTYLYDDKTSPVRADRKKFIQEIQRPVYGNFIAQIILMEKQVYSLNEQASKALANAEGSLRGYLGALNK